MRYKAGYAVIGLKIQSMEHKRKMKILETVIERK